MNNNDGEMDRKRKMNSHDQQHLPRKHPHAQQNDDDDNLLTLTLSASFQTTTPPLQPNAFINPSPLPPAPPVRPRMDPTKPTTIVPPFPWSTDRRATLHTIDYLLSKQMITSVSGDVHCKKCERRYTMRFDLRQKFDEVKAFIAATKASMHERAHPIWTNPILPTCDFCDSKNSVKPVIADKKRSINWLFLLLGQMLGCCTLDQLKYLCKHTNNHRTGAKKCVLYLAYLALCKQLDPIELFCYKADKARK